MSDFPNFFAQVPSAQNALDLFKGAWFTRLPDATGLVASTGPVRACEDYRIRWFEKHLPNGYKGKCILELGPLEAGHSYMLQQAGADEIVAIEASGRAYLKCLVMKEVFQLNRVSFLLGDFVPYLRATTENFDVIIASGVLYHQTNPLELLALLAGRCRHLFIWTHYYEADFMVSHPEIGRCFDPTPRSAEVAGFSHQLYRQSYAENADWIGFCGGGAAASSWLPKTDLLKAMAHFGFEVVETWDERKMASPPIPTALPCSSPPRPKPPEALPEAGDSAHRGFPYFAVEGPRKTGSVTACSSIAASTP